MQTIKRADGPVQQPVGNRCSECFELHEEAFIYMTWEELVGQNNTDKAFASKVAEARRVKAGSAAAPKTPEEVVESERYSLEIRRSFVVLDESELRKETNQKRLTQSLTKALCTVDCPSSAGTAEKLYFFKDEARPFRTAEIVSSHDVRHSSTRMGQYQTYLTGQGSKLYAHFSATNVDANGLGSVVEKDKQGFIKTIDEFLVSKGLKMDVDAGDAGEAARSDQNEKEEEDAP